MKKFSIFRSEQPLLKDLSPKIQALFDKKMSRIVKAQEEREEEEEKTTDELLKTIVAGIVQNANSIEKIVSQGGLAVVQKEKDTGKNLEQLSKSLESQGFIGRFVIKGKKIRVIG